MATKGATEVLLGAAGSELVLQIPIDEREGPAYQEQTDIGPEVVRPEEGKRFVDVHTSWHKGGFIKEHVQDGFYYMTENVWCLTPGEIKPAPRRITTLELKDSGSVNYHGIKAIGRETMYDDIFIIGQEAGGGSPADGRLRVYMVKNTRARAAHGADGVILTSTYAPASLSFTTQQPVFGIETVFSSGGFPRWLVPGGTAGYFVVDPTSGGAPTTVAAVLGVFRFRRVGSRVYALYMTGRGSGGGSAWQATLSNLDINADPTVAGNWTAGVTLAMVWPYEWAHSLDTFGEVPIVGLESGLWTLGPGGVPYNATPMLDQIPAAGNFSATIQHRGGIVAGLAGAGHFVYLNLRAGSYVRIGPDQNPLAYLPATAVVQHMAEDMEGRLWAYIQYPNGHPDLGTSKWQMWVGHPQGQGYAWHPIWQDFNTNEGIPTLETAIQPFLPVAWRSGTQERDIVMATGAAANVQRLQFLNGDFFFGHQVYEAEDKSGGYTVPVSFRSGRYSRHDPRVKRHWTGLRFLGKNITSGSGNLGGRIQVTISVDGGAFTNPPAGATFLTGSDNFVPLNSVARDLEYKLTWQLDGLTGGGANSMRTAPATVTQVQWEGHEVPSDARLIEFVVLGYHQPQAGGVRQKTDTKSLMDSINNLRALGDVNFVDPFKISRTVSVLPPQMLTAREARAQGVPEGAIRVRLLEAVSA